MDAALTVQLRCEESNEIDEVFEELRGKLIQLDRKNAQSEKQSEEIDRLLAEKKEAFLKTEKLKFINQELEGQISILGKTAKQAESQKNELQERYGDLKAQNERLVLDNEKLAAANQKLQTELTELQKNHSVALEKMTAWHNIQQELSARQTQNHLKMLDIAKKIGHAKATSLYIHQLKEQVDVMYKSAFDTIKHLRDSRDNMDSVGSKPGPSTSQSKDRFPNDQAPRTSDSMDTSANWRQTETYWKSVNDALRSEIQGYKEELWSSLQTLHQLSVNAATGSNDRKTKTP